MPPSETNPRSRSRDRPGRQGGAPTTHGPELRLLPAALALWVLAVVGVELGGEMLLAAIALLLGLTAILALSGRPEALRGALPGHLALLGLGLVLLIPGVLRYDAAVAVLTAAKEDSRIVEVEVSARGDPEIVDSGPAWSRGSVQLRAETRSGAVRTGGTDRALGTVPVLVRAEGRQSEALLSVGPGEEVLVRGRVRGDTDLIILEASSIRGAGAPGPRSDLREATYRATAQLPADEAALVRGMSIGDTRGLDPETEEILRRAGISHLVAVSGANIAIVLAAVLVPLLILGVPRRPRILAASALVLGYVVLVGPEPSVLRAATMAAPLLLARFLGVRGSPLGALALTIFLWSILDPVTSASIGFVLSALATGAIIVLAPPLGRILRSLSGDRLPETGALVLAVPLVAQSACTPVLILLAPEVSLWAVPVNIAVAPIVGPTTILAILGVVLAPVSPQAASAVCGIAGGGAHLVLLIAGAADTLPGSRITVPGGLVGAALAVLVLLGAAVALVLRRRRGVRWITAAVLVALLAPPLATRVSLERAGGWIIAACAVGQGDAVLLRPTRGDATVLIDTGPDPQLLESCLDRLGVGRIDLLVITHPHADHSGGRGALIGARSPREQWICPIDAAVGQTAEGAPARAVTTGTAAEIGDMGLEVLWPPDAGTAESAAARESGGGEGDAANDCSVVVSATWADGRRYVGLGDLEPEAQAQLRQTNPGRAEVVKIAHHGSGRQDAGLYALLDPEVMLITVGADNSFGHPRPEALSLSQQVADQVVRTDRHGTILVPTDPADAVRGIGPAR